MALLTPKSNAYIGGLTKLKFDQEVSNIKLKLNNVYFHVEEDKDIPSQEFTVDLNCTTPGNKYTLELSFLDKNRNEIHEFVRVIKPNHDLGGMGATVVYDNNTPTGTFFKFWLPKVKDVFVRGCFNGWRDVNRLDQLGESGYWFGYSNIAKAGDDYKFFVYTYDNKFDYVSDPAARQTIKTKYNKPDENDANAVIVDPKAFSWKYDNYFLNEKRDLSLMNIYQVHWGTFFHKGEDNPTYEKFTDSLTAKLKYIKDLGFTALELLPIHEANGNTDAGYNPSFFFAVESTYGSPDDLRKLVDEAHKFGLAVIFDSVINHLTSDLSHSSFSQEFIEGWYIQKDAPWSNHKQWGGSDWGPDPDYDRMEIKNLLTDCMIMYAEEYHIDGIRFDATTTIPDNALKEIITKLKCNKYCWNKILIAEHLTDEPLGYVVGKIGFTAGWYKPAYDALEGKVLGQLQYGSLDSLRKAYETNYNGRPTTAVKYITSHDEAWTQNKGMSISKRMGGSNDAYVRMKVRLGYATTTLSLGIPMMFMGTECMDDTAWNENNGYGNMSWDPNNGSNGANFKTMIRDINNLRKSHGALRGSNIDQKLVHRDDTNHIIAYKRWDQSGGVFLLIFNISDNQWEKRQYQVQTDTPYTKWHECFNSQYVNYGGWTGSGNADNSFYPKADYGGLLQGINVPKWSVMIFKKIFDN